ncbi:MAG: DsrE family protein [Deltaproteobacteria bacterium]|jgi:intracellular sulfur oxidation DsrE/DsrF family protein|nr:DsrE family protein [Deltaproteobacteria bacterium]MCL6119486.1 DsrE family protein [Deltaproteobacteria bacterium]
MEKSRLFLSLSMIIAVSILLLSYSPKAYALKYGPSSYSSYPAYYNTHALPLPEFFKHKTMKMVVEVDYAKPARWGLAIANIKNVMAAFGDNSFKYKLELVVFGPGIRMVMNKFDKKNEAVLQSLVTYGLKIRACHNTMLKAHLTKKALFPFVKVVPAGVIEIARKEMQGYAFLKP